MDHLFRSYSIESDIWSICTKLEWNRFEWEWLISLFSKEEVKSHLESEKWNYKKLPLELKKVHDVLIHIAKYITPKTPAAWNQSQNKLLTKKKSLADQVIQMQS